MQAPRTVAFGVAAAGFPPEPLPLQTRAAAATPRPIRNLRLPLAQLAVLAATAVIAAELRFPVIFGRLTGNAQPHARQRGTSGLWNRTAAPVAVRRRRSGTKLLLRTTDPVLDGRVDLFLNGAVSGPTCRQDDLLNPIQMIERN